MSLQYVKANRIILKQHPTFNEKWLQDRISEDPSILGLGDLVLLDRERRQERAGRLDLLLADLDNNRRFEVELMLGATDESHIIRTIEYWDIERRRFPSYEHNAVIVAEDITSRFLNILGLFAGTIPIIAIQLSALQVDNKIVLDFAKVIDRTALRTDDEAEVKLATVDRDYWNKRSTKTLVDLSDQLLEMVNEVAEPKFSLNLNKYYIGLSDGVRTTTFLLMRPKKAFFRPEIKVSNCADWSQRFEEAGAVSSVADGRVQLTLDPKSFDKHQELLRELVQQACKEYQA